MSKRNNYLLIEVLENIEQKSSTNIFAAGVVTGIAIVVVASRAIIITWLRMCTHFSNTPL